MVQILIVIRTNHTSFIHRGTLSPFTSGRKPTNIKMETTTPEADTGITGHYEYTIHVPVGKYAYNDMLAMQTMPSTMPTIHCILRKLCVPPYACCAQHTASLTQYTLHSQHVIHRTGLKPATKQKNQNAVLHAVCYS